MIRIDTTEMALRSKSHSAKDFDSALQNGGAIWILDSGTSGKDDYLIYGEDTTVEEIMDELISFFELGVYGEGVDARDPFDQERPNAWRLRRLSTSDLEAEFPVKD